jgi:hypothetical protein
MTVIVAGGATSQLSTPRTQIRPPGFCVSAVADVQANATLRLKRSSKSPSSKAGLFAGQRSTAPIRRCFWQDEAGVKLGGVTLPASELWGATACNGLSEKKVWQLR